MKDEQVKYICQIKLAVKRRDEQGFALVAALIILILLGVISATVLTFSTSETRAATSEIKRTEAFYAAEAKLEEMTNRFNKLFQSSVEPPPHILNNIANTSSTNLHDIIEARGFNFSGSTLAIDQEKVKALTAIFGTDRPFIKIPDGPYYGMSATVTPYVAVATATETNSGTSVQLLRNFNSYLLPVFQFSLFSDGDIELDPGKPMYISGRVHANKNVYALRNLLFTGNITAAGELVRDVNRGGGPNDSAIKPDSIGVKMMVKSGSNNYTIPFYNSTARIASVTEGPNYYPGTPSADNPTPPGYHPFSKTGTKKPASEWDDTSILPPSYNGHPGRFNKQVLTATSQGLAIEPLTLPLGLDGVKPVELIKRSLSIDTPLIKDARYTNKAQIRILIDDEDITDNDAGIPLPAGSEILVNDNGVNLSSFNPVKLCSSPCTLRRIDESGNYKSDPLVQQLDLSNNVVGDAQTVRGVRGVPHGTGASLIPAGAGIRGHILIQVVKNGVTTDVTRDILSMGMTVGEPNAIVQLQRPLWAAFVQNSFDRLRLTNRTTLYDIQRENISAGWERDGEIIKLHEGDFDDGVFPGPPAAPTPVEKLGFIKTPLTALNEDSSVLQRKAQPPPVPNAAELNKLDPDTNPFPDGADFNAIVPINVYNVREGWISNRQEERYVYKRGVTSVVDINMRNLARWLDGKFDTNLLAGSDAKSTNIGSTTSGYILYVSDRRGDKPKPETPNSTIAGSNITTTNGDVDNENVYFDPSQPIATAVRVDNEGTPNTGEDVIINSIFQSKSNRMQKDEAELPDSLIDPDTAAWEFSSPPTPTTPFKDRLLRAIKVLKWDIGGPLGAIYFRRSVRLSYGENLTTTCVSGGISGAPAVETWNCDNTVTNPKLSQTKGITVASENMVYIAGNYNTTGVGTFTDGGSNLNTGKISDYLGPQVPASIICDAFFPLSKTWFDANSIMYPEGNKGGKTFSYPIYRKADEGMTLHNQETAVRTAIMFGSTLSALNAASGPARDSNGTISSGGMHSAPRFLELWNGNDLARHWSFTGSMVTLFNSTQAFAPWSERAAIYQPPVRNWSYDSTFSNPNRLPPGTPFFQYVQSSGFQQIVDR